MHRKLVIAAWSFLVIFVCCLLDKSHCSEKAGLGRYASWDSTTYSDMRQRLSNGDGDKLVVNRLLKPVEALFRAVAEVDVIPQGASIVIINIIG